MNETVTVTLPDRPPLVFPTRTAFTRWAVRELFPEFLQLMKLELLPALQLKANGRQPDPSVAVGSDAVKPGSAKL